MGTKYSKPAFGLLLVALFVVGATARLATAQTPSELLQKAIYTEETVGDLDAAMKLYEQVIDEAKSGQEAAAQAQYRLALCYEKKGRDADAAAAFEALIENYPNAKNLVAEARKHLPSKELNLLPTPWILGERAQYDMKLPTGLPIGSMIYLVDGAKHDGKDITRCSSRGIVTINNGSSCSWVLCESESFEPISSFWKHSLLGEATAKYGDSSVAIELVGRKDAIDLDFTPPTFDNEQGVELFRRLPLAVGYKSTITVISTLMATKVELGLEVPEKESITVPAGTFECYKLVLNIGQTFWISTDEHRYLVRFVAGGVSADLTKVWQEAPGQTTPIDDGNFSLALPAGWLSYAPPSQPGREEKTMVFLLDPRAEADAKLALASKATLDESERASSEAWTESFIDTMKKSYKDFVVREPGIDEVTVSGLPAARFIADFTKEGKKMSIFGIALLGAENAASLNLTASADEFAALQPEFSKAVIDSFQLK